jgi:hypothetical protein
MILCEFLSLVRIFNAIPSSIFSAAAELRPLTPISTTFADVPMISQTLNPLAKSCSIHPRRLNPSDTIEERLGKARSSMALKKFTKNHYQEENEIDV